jgi:NADH-quinone oxidoreductase subunit G
MAEQLVQLKINGQDVVTRAGTSILEAARQNGILVPHFCYHPHLPVVGNCRMCQVDIEGIPKLQIACATPVREGMSVQTENERVTKARKGVLEMLLINHPVDCPVCDQAGECSLQDYYMKHGLYESRFGFRKHKRAKAVEIGPHVLLDQERCVLCTRCVRYTSDVTRTGELVVEQRGHMAQISLFPGKVLDNPYSGNVVDVCPVGALLSKDFRFQSRVWFLRESKSICPGCSRGCNIRVDSRGQRIFRLLPRENLEVNKVWLCDDGRFGFGFVNAPDRVQAPAVRFGDERRELTWPMALAELGERIGAVREAGGKLAVLGSAQSSCETLFLLARLAREALGGAAVAFGQSRLGTTGSQRSDDFLEEPDKNPNTRGAHEILGGDGLVTPAELRARIEAGEITGLVAVDFDPLAEPDAAGWQAALGRLELLALLESNHSPSSSLAHVVLPLCSFAEQDGTFVNSDGRVQRFWPAFAPLGNARPGWMVLRDLGRGLGMERLPDSAEAAFAALAAERGAFAPMSYAALGERGLPLSDAAMQPPPPAGDGALSAQQANEAPLASTLPVGSPGPTHAFGWRQWSWERKRPWE